MGIGIGSGVSKTWAKTNANGGGGTGFTQNLVASWQFESNFNDYTTNHNATATGTVTNNTTGKVGNEADFDGSGDYLTVSDSNDFSFTDGAGNDTSFSFTTWVNRDVGVNSMLFNKRDATSGGDEYMIYLKGGGTLQVSLFDNASNAIYLSVENALDIALNVWHHLAVTYDGSETAAGIKIYLDGVSRTVSDVSTGVYTGMANGTSDVVIGGAGWSPTILNLNGTLDEMKVYKNRVLTQEEITSMYDSENAGTSVL